MNNIKSKLKKLLLFAAMSVMGAMSAAATTYTLSLSGAKAVYCEASTYSAASLPWAQGVWGDMVKPMYLDEKTAKQKLSGESWTEVYAHAESKFGSSKFKGGDGTFSICSEDSGVNGWVLMVLTDATEISPGAAFSVYYATSALEGGAITIQGGPIDSGKLKTDSDSPMVNGYTLNLSGAKAVYALSGSKSSEDLSWAQGLWQGRWDWMFLDESVKEQYDVETWAEAYDFADKVEFVDVKFSGSNGNFSFNGDVPNPNIGQSIEEIQSWVLMVLTDATEFSPGAAYSVYYGTSDSNGGAITIQGSPIASGNLKTDSTPTAGGYTLSLPGAKAVYIVYADSESIEDLVSWDHELTSGSDWAAKKWNQQAELFLDKEVAKMVCGKDTWAEAYPAIASMFGQLKFPGSNGSFTISTATLSSIMPGMGLGAQSWVLMALTDATEFTPGAAYSIYLGTSALDFSEYPEHAVQQPPPLGGPITIQGSPIASGKLMTDSGTPTVDGYTLNLSGAKAVYFLAAVDSSESLSWAQGTWQGTIESMFLDETTAKQQFSGETWTEVYAHIESMLGSINKFKGGDGTFSICSEDSGGFGGVSEVSGWTLMVLTDATEVAPGAAYSIYYGTSDLKGGAITIQGSPIASGNLKTDTPVSADPSVTIDKVATVEPWDSMKGEITVDYSLGGIDSKYEYKVAFDVTAGGKTASITNAAAKLTAGKQPQQTINTVELFGKETVDKEAKLKISLIVVKPKESAPVQGGVQLWANGPFWAESNLGSADDVTHPEYGLLYTHDAAVNALPSGWRLPTKDELAALLDESKCSKQQTSQNGVEGCLFTSKSDPSKSVFLPYGGTGGNNGTTRKYCTMVGVYWSSTFDTPETPWTLGISSSENHMGNADLVSSGHLVRPVRDAE